MDSIRHLFLVLALFPFISQYCLTKAEYDPPPPPHHHHPFSDDTYQNYKSQNSTSQNSTSQNSTSQNSTSQNSTSQNSTITTQLKQHVNETTSPHQNESTNSTPPEALECQHFVVTVTLKKPPPGPAESGPFDEMKCHICDNIKMIYRCYPCFTSVEVHNVTTLANNHSAVNLLMKFTCHGKHLKVLEAILKPHSILNSKCFKPHCPALAPEEHEAPCPAPANQCTAPVCVGTNQYHVTPYPTPCPTSYPANVVNVPAQQVHQQVPSQASFPLPYPYVHPSPYYDSHTNEKGSEENKAHEEKENENENGEQKEAEPQPIQLVGQTYIFPESYGQHSAPRVHENHDKKGNEKLPQPYINNYGYPTQYPLSIYPQANPCTPQCLNVCAPSCHPACCRSRMSERYKAFIRRMRNAANARTHKYRNPLGGW